MNGNRGAYKSMISKQFSSPAVVLLSGGLDSTVLLHHAVKDLQCAPVYALSFRYGQRHGRELDCAVWQAKAAGVAEHQVLDISFLGELLRDGTALVSGGADVPDLAELSEHDLEQPPTYVPNRNMVLLSLAAAWAEAKGCRDVYYGAQAQDEYGYWDCTTDFVARINETLALNRRNAVQIHAPFATARKARNVEMGLRLGVDFGHTWSCYRGGEQPCMTCPTCVERVHAFAEAGADDPLVTRCD